MSDVTVTIIDDGRATAVPGVVDGDTVRLPAPSVRAALGWDVEPEGLCREGLCVPYRADAPALDADGADVTALATILDRPVAVDAAERVAAFGVSATERARTLSSLRAPDFSLPDLHGRMHTLSEHRGKKVFLVAYASW